MSGVFSTPSPLKPCDASFTTSGDQSHMSKMVAQPVQRDGE
jgi:hypothetical protein